jgi:single-strand DNA-binding protein
MNIIAITGRLTAQPELKTTQNGVSVCSFTLAVKRPRVKDTTDFINCVAWRQSAEYLCKYANKGDSVELTGSLQSRNYEDKNGNKRTAFDVVADDLRVNSNRSAENTTNNGNPQLDAFTANLKACDIEFEEVIADGDTLPF